MDELLRLVLHEASQLFDQKSKIENGEEEGEEKPEGRKRKRGPKREKPKLDLSEEEMVQAEEIAFSDCRYL